MFGKKKELRLSRTQELRLKELKKEFKFGCTSGTLSPVGYDEYERSLDFLDMQIKSTEEAGIPSYLIRELIEQRSREETRRGHNKHAIILAERYHIDAVYSPSERYGHLTDGELKEELGRLQEELGRRRSGFYDKK